MDIEAYLKRIDYDGPTSVDAETLRALQSAHLRAVPFENLSIHAGEPIVLNEDPLFKKIVDQRRGGFCYECNGLFAGLLRGLGFQVDMLAAGVARPDGSFGPEFDHMTLLVTLEDRWLVDVGFGDSFMEPLLLDARVDQEQGSQTFQVLDADAEHLILRRRKDSDWEPQYRFNLKPRRFSEYEHMCRYHQTSPESHFTKGLICSRATENGRITLNDMRFITTTGSARHEQELPSREAFAHMLKEQFGIVMKNQLRFAS